MATKRKTRARAAPKRKGRTGEGDPAKLMEQQIKLEEYQFLRTHPGPPYEPRPW